MSSEILFKQDFNITGGDYVNAGESSIKIRNILKEIGIDAEIIRKIAIAAYEAEMNVVMYAENGIMSLIIVANKIFLNVEDKGQGITDIGLAMQPGYSTATEEMREMGFGAGMGLPNIKRNADVLKIDSTVGKGTKLEITFNLDNKDG
jgi:anti-sigma regulatory factor (Ser/Thr protein kinase)